MSVSLPEDLIPTKVNTYDYESALRNRLGSINEMGAKQNQYAQQKALQDTQRQIQAENDRYASSLRNQSQNQAQPQGQQTSSGGGYSNGATANSPNPRNAQQALEYAKQAAANGDSGWYRRCLAFVAQAYGLPASGSNTAIESWNRDRSIQHLDRNPMIGAPVYWDTGAGRAGHVALYAGNGMVYSTDIGNGAGRIGYVPMDQIDQQWGAKYVGWTDPYFATSPR